MHLGENQMQSILQQKLWLLPMWFYIKNKNLLFFTGIYYILT